MKDFLQTYHKKEKKLLVFLAGGALLLALGVNFYLFDNAELGKSMKTSMLDAQMNGDQADVYLQASNKQLELRNAKPMQNIVSLSASIVFDPETTSLKDIDSTLGEVTLLGEASDGVITVLVDTTQKSIASSTSLFTLTAENTATTPINVLNANFRDASGTSFELTTSGTLLP